MRAGNPPHSVWPAGGAAEWLGGRFWDALDWEGRVPYRSITLKTALKDLGHELNSYFIIICMLVKSYVFQWPATQLQVILEYWTYWTCLGCPAGRYIIWFWICNMLAETNSTVNENVCVFPYLLLDHIWSPVQTSPMLIEPKSFFQSLIQFVTVYVSVHPEG